MQTFLISAGKGASWHGNWHSNTKFALCVIHRTLYCDSVCTLAAAQTAMPPMILWLDLSAAIFTRPSVSPLHTAFALLAISSVGYLHGVRVHKLRVAKDNGYLSPAEDKSTQAKSQLILLLRAPTHDFLEVSGIALNVDAEVFCGLFLVYGFYRAQKSLCRDAATVYAGADRHTTPDPRQLIIIGHLWFFRTTDNNHYPGKL